MDDYEPVHAIKTDRVKIYRHDRVTLVGTFLSQTDFDVTVEVAGQRVHVEKKDIQTFTVCERSPT